MSVLFALNRYIAVPILLEWLSMKETLQLDTVATRNHRLILHSWFSEFSDIFFKRLFSSHHLHYTYEIYLWSQRFELDFSNLIGYLSDINSAVLEQGEVATSFIEYLFSIKHLNCITKPELSHLISLSTTCCNLRSIHMERGDESLSTVCRNCPQITSVKVNFGLSLAATLSIIINARNLETLEVDNEHFENIQPILFFLYCKAPLVTLIWPNPSSTYGISYLGSKLKTFCLYHCFSSGAESLGVYCPNLTNLDIHSWTERLDLGAMISLLPQLLSLTLDYAIQWSDEDILAIANTCKSLQCLRFKTMYKQLEVQTISAIADNLTQLEILELPKGEINDYCLLLIAMKCKNLTELDVSLNQPTLSTISDDSVTILATNCKELRKLSVCNTSIGDGSLIALAAHCKHLYCLNLDHCYYVTDIGVVEVMNHCPLTYLNVDQCGLLTRGVVDTVMKLNNSHSN